MFIHSVAHFGLQLSDILSFPQPGFSSRLTDPRGHPNPLPTIRRIPPSAHRPLPNHHHPWRDTTTVTGTNDKIQLQTRRLGGNRGRTGAPPEQTTKARENHDHSSTRRETSCPMQHPGGGNQQARSKNEASTKHPTMVDGGTDSSEKRSEQASETIPQTQEQPASPRPRSASTSTNSIRRPNRETEDSALEWLAREHWQTQRMDRKPLHNLRRIRPESRTYTEFERWHRRRSRMLSTVRTEGQSPAPDLLHQTTPPCHTRNWYQHKLPRPSVQIRWHQWLTDHTCHTKSKDQQHARTKRHIQLVKRGPSQAWQVQLLRFL